MFKLSKTLLSIILMSSISVYGSDQQKKETPPSKTEADAKQQGAQEQTELDYALAEAACGYNEDDERMAKVESLLNQKANPNALRRFQFDHSTKLHCLFLAKHKPRTLQLLLQAKADPNDQNTAWSHCPNLTPHWKKSTALMGAAYEKCPQAVRVLIDGKANLNAQDARGKTALHWLFGKPYGYLGSVSQPSLEILEALLKAKADCNINDKNGETPILKAAKYWPAEKMQLLLDSKGDPNKGDNRRNQPLIAALEHRKEDVARLLIFANANCSAGTICDPLYLAQIRGYKYAQAAIPTQRERDAKQQAEKEDPASTDKKAKDKNV